jgi:hypothetical protein
VKRSVVFFALALFAPKLAFGDDASTPAVDYVTQIKPILVARCYSCHSALRKKSGLRLDTAAALIEGGDAGPAVEPGDASASYLIEMLTGDSGTRMPPESEGSAISAEQVELFKRWINEGAHAPAEVPQPDPREHWAYHAPIRPAVPQVRNAAWVRNPVDAFIAAWYDAEGLTPVAEADKSTLLRRLYLDLVGLPPTPEEQSAFLSSRSPTAYEDVVDRLLASPQYGERWARHWMDVWRYSDWSGYKEEVRDSARHLWRWRDWIVESLNADKGYDRMATEMLAGDEIAPTDPQILRATGFLVRDWYKFNRDVWLQATVEHTGKAFLGVTMNCCRCHDHKFDPISQFEYYRFRAIFEPYNLRTERMPGEAELTKNGLSRACDLTPETPTYLLERGDERRPKKDVVITAGTPEVFGSALKVVPVEMPALEYYPALQEFALKEDLTHANDQIAAAEQSLAKAEAAVADAQKRLVANAAAAPVAAQVAGTNGQATTPSQTVAADGKKDVGTNEPKAKVHAPIDLASLVTTAESAAKHAATARAGHESLIARIAADKAKYGLTSGADASSLAVIAAKAERQFTLFQAQEQHDVAEHALIAAKAAAKPNDAASAKTISDDEKKLTDAAATLAKAHAAMADTNSNYTPLGTEIPHQSTGRRLAFAKWLVDRNNPLTARVAINHIWLRHFGAPLVDNTFDFGLRSPEPRNQPLLDWLAVELMENGWQMKHIHRLIVTSNAYRLSSSSKGATEKDLAADRDNHFLWRMNPRRLEAEAIRDSVFATAGNLDLTRGGPDIAFKLASDSPRRSIYFQYADEKMSKLLQVFDNPSVNECYRRNESVVPQQALAMANSDVSLNESRLLAKKLSESVSKEQQPEQEFVRLAYEHILAREPSSTELSECGEFLKKQSELLKDPAKLAALGGGEKATVQPATDPIQRAREDLTLVLFNHNDFVTIR